MKVEVNEIKKQEDKEYPYLGIDTDGMIILFATRNNGTILNKGKNPCSNFNFGDFTNGIYDDSFEKFEGSITLSND